MRELRRRRGVPEAVAVSHGRCHRRREDRGIPREAGNPVDAGPWNQKADHGEEEEGAAQEATVQAPEGQRTSG